MTGGSWYRKPVSSCWCLHLQHPALCCLWDLRRENAGKIWLCCHCCVVKSSLGPVRLWPPLALGCAEAEMKVVLQRVRADPRGGKLAQGQHKMIPFSLASAEIPDWSPENAQRRCWQNSFSPAKPQVFSSSSIWRASWISFINASLNTQPAMWKTSVQRWKRKACKDSYV